ncbi:MAG: presenilin family intramembrane aspartyl protease, partial [Thermoproteota archaeon]
VKLRLELLLKGLFYFSAFIVLFITISVLIASRSIPAAESGTGTWTETGTGQEGGYLLPEPFIWLILPILVAAIMLIVLHKFYRWYIVDAIGIFLSSSIAAWFGASLSPILIVVLLLLMALYDYLVVRSGKMVSIAENTLKMNLPTMVMSPMKKIPEKLEGEGERKGALLGLGDIAFPNMLTVSTYLENIDKNILGIPVNILAAMIVLFGSIAGLITVLYVVHRCRKPQPGLPYIGLGSILAWLASRALLLA